MTEFERTQKIEAAAVAFIAQLTGDLIVTEESVQELLHRIYSRLGVSYCRCTFCSRPTPCLTAHLHQGVYVGDLCCWDERLRASE